jgi:choline dehydrogenase-like flavoprotein
MGGGGYVPRFRNLQNREAKFLRGYAYDFWSGGQPNPRYFPLYGEALQKEMAATRDAGFAMTTMGEVLPRFESHVRINKDVQDAWGIPVLHMEMKYTDNEHNMAADSMAVAEEICRGAGFEVIARHAQMVPPGESIHELGTCRMGNNPKTSVLNRFNQSHDVKNLFVLDGSAFVSGGCQNPTMTILALSMRASEYIADQMRTRAI